MSFWPRRKRGRSFYKFGLMFRCNIFNITDVSVENSRSWDWCGVEVGNGPLTYHTKAGDEEEPRN